MSATAIGYKDSSGTWRQIGEIPATATTPTPTPTPSPTGNKDRYGTIILNTIKSGGTKYEPAWDNGQARDVKAGTNDPYDKINFINGSGVVKIDGKGIANMTGPFPRFYITGQTRVGGAGTFSTYNTELTYYAKRIADGNTAYAGISSSVRTQHHLEAGEAWPNVNSMYARMMNNGYIDFYWEQNHHDSRVPDRSLISKKYFTNGLPKNEWIGYKFILKNISSSQIVLEMHIDRNEANKWEKILSLDITDTNIVGRLSKPGTTFIRNDNVQEFLYKKLSIIEVVPS